ncbi:hypothetical protein BaRGS_00016367 [Batillaria attramentaria]|uniref:SRCR domain-containing protein n=1 Tax=Batillaria attramentaria TaxID=370345 RepID=A0ABD0KZ40_9CAEN
MIIITALFRKVQAAPQSASSEGPSPLRTGAMAPSCWMDVTCRGNESSILDCQHRGLGVVWFCDHSKDVGLDCLPPCNY